MRATEISESSPRFLAQAQKSAQEQHWQEVNYYLPQLSCLATQSSFANTDEVIRSQVRELALSVLINGDFQQKWQVAKLFPVMDQEAIAPLVALLDNPTVSNETIWFAANILGNFSSPEVVIALAQLLQSTSESDLIAIAAKSLAQIGTLAIDALIALLDKPESRLIAAKSLAHIRLASVLPVLIKLAEDRNPEIRLLAIEALGSFHDRQIPFILIKALQDVSSKVRKEAVVALGFCAEQCQELDLVTHLQPLLYDFNLDVCRQAAISLGRMRNGAASQVLNEALQTSELNFSLKADVVKALAWSENSQALDYLQTACTIDNNWLCQEIITVLGRITSVELQPKAIAILEDFWYSATPEALNLEQKKALATALGELQAISARGILKQLATDINKMVQLSAIASLKKLD